MATIRDVAKRANVSVATVSRYLNGAQLREDNRARIAEAIDELRYQPNLIGRAFATAHSYTVGILINSATNPFAGSLMGLIERELERLGSAAVFVEYQGDADFLREKVDFLQMHQVDGLIVVLSDVELASVGFLRETDVPLVLVDNPLVGPSADSIVVDNCEAVRKAVGAMLDAGHRRVGLVAMLPHTHVGAERARGWRLAFEERGLCADEGLVRACDNVKDAAALATDELLGAGATAVFACNYYLELGALKSMLRRSLRPGIDVGFAGFDEIDFADIFDPAPTCVIQPIVAIASLAASLLVALRRTASIAWPARCASPSPCSAGCRRRWVAASGRAGCLSPAQTALLRKELACDRHPARPLSPTLSTCARPPADGLRAARLNAVRTKAPA